VSLSDHEVALGFQEDVDDPSVWVRFRHRSHGHPLDQQLEGASFLAWTTTPWTLLANSGLAVNPEAEYLVVEREAASGSERLVVARARLETLPGTASLKSLRSFRGDQLQGLRYEPLFPQVPASETENLANAYRVVSDNFVSLGEGTGVVHLAPAYGDLELGRKYGLPTIFSIDVSGHVPRELDRFGSFSGLFFKDADPIIIRYLRDHGYLFEATRVKHSYPFCWRCGSPLLYYAKPSWYIRTTARKDRLLANNDSINWVPQHIKTGRFGNWLANNVDWALSRERYWGTPLPIWICEACGKTDVVGSIGELALLSNRDVSNLDLHRPYVDEISWVCASCRTGTMRRVPDLADAWFDSGSMPVAQWHYPYEHSEIFEAACQADYISEAIDQTRGWFYTLHAVSTLLFDRPAFKNVISLGHILDAKGEKMSKSKGNVVDPWILMDLYGADATRWYMYSSAPPYNPRRFAPEHVGEVVRQFMLPIWNTYAMFVTYANVDRWTPKRAAVTVVNPTDRWILGELHTLVLDSGSMLEDYDIFGPTKRIQRFAEDLSNWYVRRNRRRFWKSENDVDKDAAYQTLYTCLSTLARVLAPFMPFVSEAMYQNLVADQVGGAASVHLTSWPEYDPAIVDEQLLRTMRRVLEVARLGRAARRQAGIRIRQPLSELLVQQTAGDGELRAFEDDLREELNVQQIRFLGPGDAVVSYRIKPNPAILGRKYGRLLPMIRSQLAGVDQSSAAEMGRLVAARQPVLLEIDGQQLQLQPEELTVEPTSLEGYAVSGDGRVLVALNTVITPALRLQGQARDLVRAIQEGRKSLDLNIVDRILVVIETSDDLDVRNLLDAHGDYIGHETLADQVRPGDPRGSSLIVEAEVGDGVLHVGISKVSTAQHGSSTSC
jgi:isoleucyl-tRNA synthetase